MGIVSWGEGPSWSGLEYLHPVRYPSTDPSSLGMPAMANAANFIPIDLRNRLDADGERAAQARDRKCAEVLRQLATYTGNDAAQHARDLGAEPCTIRYPAARELMQLVVQVEGDEAAQRPKLR